MTRKADTTSRTRSAPRTRCRGARRRDGQRGHAVARLRPPQRPDPGGDGERVHRSVRRTCLTLVRHRTHGSKRGPRAAALGWQLDSGVLPPAEIRALCAAVRAELARAGVSPRWAAPAALSALLAEYRAVRHTFLVRTTALPTARVRRQRRPTGSA